MGQEDHVQKGAALVSELLEGLKTKRYILLQHNCSSATPDEKENCNGRLGKKNGFRPDH